MVDIVWSNDNDSNLVTLPKHLMVQETSNRRESLLSPRRSKQTRGINCEPIFFKEIHFMFTKFLWLSSFDINMIEFLSYWHFKQEEVQRTWKTYLEMFLSPARGGGWETSKLNIFTICFRNKITLTAIYSNKLPTVSRSVLTLFFSSLLLRWIIQWRKDKQKLLNSLRENYTENEKQTCKEKKA